MRQFLLDTCTLIDWAVDPSRLNEDVRMTIGNGRSSIYVSIASAWEIAIKRKIGKITAPTDVDWLLRQNRFNELQISIAHTKATTALPMHHKDPFDRLIIAQAQLEQLTLVTRDREIQKYDVPLIAA